MMKMTMIREAMKAVMAMLKKPNSKIETNVNYSLIKINELKQ